jgi:hypothetical protein
LTLTFQPFTPRKTAAHGNSGRNFQLGYRLVGDPETKQLTMTRDLEPKEEIQEFGKRRIIRIPAHLTGKKDRK